MGKVELAGRPCRGSCWLGTLIDSGLSGGLDIWVVDVGVLVSRRSGVDRVDVWVDEGVTFTPAIVVRNGTLVDLGDINAKSRMLERRRPVVKVAVEACRGKPQEDGKNSSRKHDEGCRFATESIILKAALAEALYTTS